MRQVTARVRRSCRHTSGRSTARRARLRRPRLRQERALVLALLILGLVVSAGFPGSAAAGTLVLKQEASAPFEYALKDVCTYFADELGQGTETFTLADGESCVFDTDSARSKCYGDAGWATIELVKPLPPGLERVVACESDNVNSTAYFGAPFDNHADALRGQPILRMFWDDQDYYPVNWTCTVRIGSSDT